jgi:hypothetical protein
MPIPTIDAMVHEGVMMMMMMAAVPSLLLVSWLASWPDFTCVSQMCVEKRRYDASKVLATQKTYALAS